MNQQPRMFRGRGGPTDGRLPKHNARRRKNNGQPSTKGSNKYADDDASPRLSDNTKEEENHEEGDEDDDENVSTIQNNSIEPVQAHQLQQAPPSPWRDEIQHLTRRVRNVQESIQLGTAGIANLNTYQKNVLDAVANVINEWRAILNHYHYVITTKTSFSPGDSPDAAFANLTEEHEESMEDKLDPIILKETALAVYMLLQLSVQCGPLAGGKPGYFKRCGGDVARVVAEYLATNVPDDETCKHLLFSEKQVDAVRIWRNNAEKAALENKPPSESALKRQLGKSKKKKNKK